VLVAVTGVGSVWRRRFSKNEHDLTRFAHGAYFNTTGVMVNGHVRQRPLWHFSQWCIVAMATFRAHDDGATLFG